MGSLTSPKVIKEIMQKYGFNFSKNLGQNFLIDSNIVEKIIDLSGVSKQDYVIEIGPGIGTLTEELCQRAKKVIAVEIDSKLIPILSENLKEYDNLKIIHNDILKIDINKLIAEEFEGQKVKVVANLPYYITTPIIMELLEKNLNISSITIMIQKEVAQRINAEPGTKDYGALTIAVGFYCNVNYGFIVSKNCFMPSPKVDSLVLNLEILRIPKVNVINKNLFFKLVKASFSQRRKTLNNSLANSGIIDKERAKEILNKLGYNENIRGEALSIENFADLSNEIDKIKNV